MSIVREAGWSNGASWYVQIRGGSAYQIGSFGSSGGKPQPKGASSKPRSMHESWDWQASIIVDACATTNSELEAVALRYAENVVGVRLERAIPA